MKKIYCIISACLLLIGFSSCGNSAVSEDANDAEMSIETTISTTNVPKVGALESFGFTHEQFIQAFSKVNGDSYGLNEIDFPISPANGRLYAYSIDLVPPFEATGIRKVLYRQNQNTNHPIGVLETLLLYCNESDDIITKIMSMQVYTDNAGGNGIGNFSASTSAAGLPVDDIFIAAEVVDYLLREKKGNDFDRLESFNRQEDFILLFFENLYASSSLADLYDRDATSAEHWYKSSSGHVYLTNKETLIEYHFDTSGHAANDTPLGRKLICGGSSKFTIK